MHFASLRHARDHAKVRGRAYNVLEHIALHINHHTGDAFELSVDRIADRFELTPQWVRQLLQQLIDTGELIVVRSSGRHPNRYRLPLETCHRGNPKLEFPVAEDGTDDLNPQVQLRVDDDADLNPKLDAAQPETPEAPTRNDEPGNPKLTHPCEPLPQRDGHRKEVFKEVKEKRERQDGWLSHERKETEETPPISHHRIVYGEGNHTYGWCERCHMLVLPGLCEGQVEPMAAD